MRHLLALSLAASLAAASPASAQLVVHDPTSYASLLRQASTALDQLQELKAQLGEARRLYDGFNSASGAGQLAALLDAPELRSFVPDVAKYAAAAGGDFSALGELGRSADAIRRQSRRYTPAPDDVQGQALSQDGDRAARDLALGRAAAEAGAQRLQGLQQLATQLDRAPNVRAVLDLQARMTAEQAMGLNDQMRLQGLAMAQEAEARLLAQQAREGAKAARQARMQRYREVFQ